MITHLVSFVTSIMRPVHPINPPELWVRYAANALNWQIMVFIFLTISGILAFLLIGFALVPVVLLLNLVFCVIAAIKAFNGEAWFYPLTYDFV